jgi:hypothetical protein
MSPSCFAIAHWQIALPVIRLARTSNLRRENSQVWPKAHWLARTSNPQPASGLISHHGGGPSHSALSQAGTASGPAAALRSHGNRPGLPVYEFASSAPALASGEWSRCLSPLALALAASSCAASAVSARHCQWHRGQGPDWQWELEIMPVGVTTIDGGGSAASSSNSLLAATGTATFDLDPLRLVRLIIIP